MISWGDAEMMPGSAELGRLLVLINSPGPFSDRVLTIRIQRKATKIVLLIRLFQMLLLIYL